jgi:predicted dehydrogenase
MYNLGIVGFGRVVTDLHLPSIQSLELQGRIKVATIFEPGDEQRLVARQMFPDAHCTSEFDALLDQEPDACLVASPPAFHASQTMQLATAGISVLCEKPLVASSSECMSLIHAIGDDDTLVSAAMIRRYFPAAWSIRSFINDGMFGDTIEVAVHEGGRFKWQINSRKMLDPAFAVGGVFYDVGAHILDLLRYLLGPLELQSYCDNSQANLETECQAKLKAGAANVKIKISRLQAIKNEWVFSGPKLKISWKPFSHDSFHMLFPETTSASGEFICKKLTPSLPGGYRSESYPAYPFPSYCMWDAFLRMLEGDASDTVKIRDVLPSIQLIEEAYQLRRNGCEQIDV